MSTDWIQPPSSDDADYSDGHVTVTSSNNYEPDDTIVHLFKSKIDLKTEKNEESENKQEEKIEEEAKPDYSYSSESQKSEEEEKKQNFSEKKQEEEEKNEYESQNEKEKSEYNCSCSEKSEGKPEEKEKSVSEKENSYHSDPELVNSETRSVEEIESYSTENQNVENSEKIKEREIQVNNEEYSYSYSQPEEKEIEPEEKQKQEPAKEEEDKKEEYSYSYSEEKEEITPQKQQESENQSQESTYVESNEPQEKKESPAQYYSESYSQNEEEKPKTASPSPSNSPEPSPSPSPEVTASESNSEKEEIIEEKPKPAPKQEKEQKPQQLKRKSSRPLLLKSTILAVKKQIEIIETSPAPGNYDDGKVVVDPRGKNKKSKENEKSVVQKGKKQRKKRYVYKEDKFHSDTDDEIEISLFSKPRSPKGKRVSSISAFDNSPSKYLVPNKEENHPDTMLVADLSDEEKESERTHGNAISEKTLFSSDSNSDVEPLNRKVESFSYKNHRFLERNKDGTITMDNDDEIFVHKSPRQQIRRKYDDESNSKHRHHHHKKVDSNENSKSVSQKKAPKIRKISKEHADDEDTPPSPRKISKFLKSDSDDDNVFDFTLTNDNDKKKKNQKKYSDARSNASNKPVAHDRSEASSSFFYEPRKNK